MQAYILVDGSIERTSSLEEVCTAHAAGKKMWVDLERRTPDIDHALRDTFGIHPLVVEDIWSERSIPKMDEFDEYLYVVVHGVRRESTPKKVELFMLDIVFAQDFVLTQHRDPFSAEAVRTRLMKEPRLLVDGAAWLAHAFLDDVVDRYLPLIDALGGALERVEHDVLATAAESGERDLLPELFALKRAIHSVDRITHHQRDILQRLSRCELREVPREAMPYFRDVHDHFTRVADRADALRDIIVDVTDAFLGVQSSRMNSTVKRLTLISTLMLPLTLVTGFYGMNFRHMPELQWKWGELYALGLLVLVAASALTYLKRKRWI